MEEFARELLDLGTFTRILLSWVVMVVSAGLAVMATKSTWKISNGAYFLCVGFIVFLLCATNLLYLPVTHAIEHQYLSVLIGVQYTMMVAAGALAGLVSAARSLDAFGTRDRWFLGLVPVANLVLVFAKSQVQAKADDKVYFINAGMVVLGLGFAVIGIKIGGFVDDRVGNAVETATAQKTDPDKKPVPKSGPYTLQPVNVQPVPLRDAPAPEKAQEDTVPEVSSELADALKKTAASLKVPYNAGPMTITAVDVDADRIIYTFVASDPSSSQIDELFEVAIADRCNPLAFPSLFALGGTVVTHFLDKDNKVIREFAANSFSCSMRALALDEEMVQKAKAEKGYSTADGQMGLTGASYADGVYSYHYYAPDPVPEGTTDIMKKHICTADAYKPMLLRGITVRGTIQTKSGRLLDEFSLTGEQCGNGTY